MCRFRYKKLLLDVVSDDHVILASHWSMWMKWHDPHLAAIKELVKYDRACKYWEHWTKTAHPNDHVNTYPTEEFVSACVWVPVCECVRACGNEQKPYTPMTIKYIPHGRVYVSHSLFVSAPPPNEVKYKCSAHPQPDNLYCAMFPCIYSLWNIIFFVKKKINWLGEGGEGGPSGIAGTVPPPSDPGLQSLQKLYFAMVRATPWKVWNNTDKPNPLKTVPE